ncbi:MAG TPA: glycosyltransferase [Gemmataceae bacterium]|jgi:glycosyltransferase involved in cell wall biosynthesis|nr:glycosyltransferase [Gemmataceae bacterium]
MIRTLLFLVPDLNCHGWAKQAMLLACALPKDQFGVHVGVLGEEGVFLEPLRAAGIPAHLFGARRLSAWFALKRLLRQLSPELVQTWGSALPWAALAKMARLGWPKWKLLAVDPPKDFWLGLADSVVVSALQQVLENRHCHWHVIPPAVQNASNPSAQDVSHRELALPEGARYILCAGAIEKGHGFRVAVWIFDILQYIYPDLWLVIAGDGPERNAVEAFTRSRGWKENRVKFLGIRNDIPRLLEPAELVWVCGRHGGRNLALEALAAGKPAVARYRPEFVELLGEAETGFLVRSGRASDFAHASRRILDDPLLAHDFAEAARNRAARFALPRILKQWLDLYAEFFPQDDCNPPAILSR